MPDKLSDLDLDAFAEELERQDYGNKKTTLYDIRNELFAPFKERRGAYVPMTEVHVCTMYFTGVQHVTVSLGNDTEEHENEGVNYMYMYMYFMSLVATLFFFVVVFLS